MGEALVKHNGTQVDILANDCDRADGGNGSLGIKGTWNNGPLSCLKIFKKIIKGSYDVTHIHHETFLYGEGFGILTIPFLLLLLKLARKKVIVTMHHVISLNQHKEIIMVHSNPLQRKMLKVLYAPFAKFFSLATRIMVPSSKFKGFLQEEYGFDPSKIVVLPHYTKLNGHGPNGVEAKKLLGQDDGRKVITFFGFIRPSKGIEYLMDAFRKVSEKHPEAILQVLGMAKPRNWDYSSKLLAKAKAEDLESKVIWTGYVDSEKVPLYLKASDVIVFPYLTTFPAESRGYLQALSYGRPVIMTNAISSDVKDGVHALVIPPADTPALTTAITKLIDDVPYAEQLAKNGYDYCSNRKWEDAVPLIMKAYEDTLNGH